jgi:hypothetical protein
MEEVDSFCIPNNMGINEFATVPLTHLRRIIPPCNRAKPINTR